LLCLGFSFSLEDASAYATTQNLDQCMVHNGRTAYPLTLNIQFQMMLLCPFLLLVAPLAGLAAPIGKRHSHYYILDPRTHPREGFPSCYRHWRNHGAHLNFRLARLHTCGSRPEQRYVRLNQDTARPRPLSVSKKTGISFRG